MSLGSPLQWQAALLTIVPFIDTAPPDLPKGVIITTIIGVILFCQASHHNLYGLLLDAKLTTNAACSMITRKELL